MMKQDKYMVGNIEVAMRKANPLLEAEYPIPELNNHSIIYRKGSVSAKGYMPLPVDIECVQDIAIPLRDGTMVYGDLYPVAKRHTADLSRLQKFCVFIHKAVTFRFLISPDLSLQHKCSICRWARRFHHTDFRRSYTPCQ